MGWLRELMAAAEPPIDGYGELARRALAHPDWPADTQPQARSLAALFSKLDRGIELEWLADRDAAQRALARVLGCPLESVRREVAPVREGSGAARLRFEDLPYARPFDPREEPLPPGIPRRALAPASWSRLWWWAPPGSGRTLAGQWLAARGLARFTVVRSALPDPTQLATPGPLFIELEREDAPLAAALARTLASLQLDRVCVAAPLPPPGDAGWEALASPALRGDLLLEVLRWVEARLPEDGSFDAAAAAGWLEPAIADGSLPTLGALLGAAGLLDARGLREARGKSLDELAERFVNERLELASGKGSAEAHWLERHGFSALVELAESALATSPSSWTAARSLDDWIALVPAERERGRASRARGELFEGAAPEPWPARGRAAAREGAREAARASREAPPDPYRLVHALLDARLLAERTPGLFSVSPEFLKHAALRRARDAIVRASPLVWGEALLSPHAAASVLEAVQRRIDADDFSAVEELAELDVASRPALVLAAEALFVCAGLRVLSGADVPLEQLAALHAEQLASVVELPGELPRPRLLCFTAASDLDPQRPGAGALALHPVWLLAALAIGEALGARAPRGHALLGPWREAPTRDALAPVLDLIYAALATPALAQQAWAIDAFALAARLLDGPLDADADAEADPDGDDASPRETPHALARPARLADALLAGGLPPEWLEGFGAHPLELRALEAACALRGIAWSRMAHALWKSWQSRGCPATGTSFMPSSPHAERLWPHLPPEVMAAGWARWVSSASTLPFAHFGESQWSAFVELFAMRWRLACESPIWAAAFEAMNESSLERAVLRGHLLAGAEPGVRPLLERAWLRSPTWLLAQVMERAGEADATALTRLLEAAPEALGDEIIRALSGELARRTTQRPVIDAARAWLCDQIARRRGDWRAAYALLVELEERLARAQRARGL